MCKRMSYIVYANHIYSKWGMFMAEKDLGYRRVQCTGRGSYIISLPKEWVQDIGLKRGSEIAFNLEPDSSLTLIPRKIREKIDGEEGKKLKEYYVSVDPQEDLASTLRMIQALYVISADIIRVHFRGDEPQTVETVPSARTMSGWSITSGSLWPALAGSCCSPSRWPPCRPRASPSRRPRPCPGPPGPW